MPKIIIHTDGGSRGNPGVAGAGAVIAEETGRVLKKAAKPLGVMTNNEAEYHAVLLGLDALKRLLGRAKIRNYAIEMRLDSELVASQLRGEYQIKEPKLIPLFVKVWNQRIADFPNLTFVHVPRAENREADKLANQAMDAGAPAKLF